MRHATCQTATRTYSQKHTRIFGYDGTARVAGKSYSMQLASSVSECQGMHFRHLFAANSLSSWHGHHPNMSAYTTTGAYIRC
jgi:hypothetical protein